MVDWFVYSIDLSLENWKVFRFSTERISLLKRYFQSKLSSQTRFHTRQTEVQELISFKFNFLKIMRSIESGNSSQQGLLSFSLISFTSILYPNAWIIFSVLHFSHILSSIHFRLLPITTINNDTNTFWNFGRWNMSFQLTYN